MDRKSHHTLLNIRKPGWLKACQTDQDVGEEVSCVFRISDRFCNHTTHRPIESHRHQTDVSLLNPD